MTSSLYAQLPETSETQFAREMTELQSEVKREHVHTHCSVFTMKMEMNHESAPWWLVAVLHFLKRFFRKVIACCDFGFKIHHEMASGLRSID